MLAHPAQERGTCFDYQRFLDLVVPKPSLFAEEIRRPKGARPRFPLTRGGDSTVSTPPAWIPSALQP